MEFTHVEHLEQRLTQCLVNISRDGGAEDTLTLCTFTLTCLLTTREDNEEVL